MNKHNIFRENDLVKSNLYSQKLEISANTKKIIENWFDELLDEYFKASNFEKQLITEKVLESKILKVVENFTKQEYKYVFGKILYYSNIFESCYLRPQYVPRLCFLISDTLLPHIFEKVKKEFSVAEYVSLTEYIKINYFVSPNAELLEYALKIEKSSKIYQIASKDNRLHIVKNLLEIIKSKDYHHNIICFKKILSLVTESDKEIITLLKEFRVRNKQGCYKIISTIFNFSLTKDYFNDFEIKRHILLFFDTAKGASPKEKWTIELRKIEIEVGFENLKKLTTEIKKLDDPKRFQLDKHTNWTDDVAGRILKSINWIEEQN